RRDGAGREPFFLRLSVGVFLVSRLILWQRPARSLPIWIAYHDLAVEKPFWICFHHVNRQLLVGFVRFGLLIELLAFHRFGGIEPIRRKGRFRFGAIRLLLI